ncbi:MAG: hypothetical protein AAGA23_06415 [Pseudomonadota bacterium]
MQMPGRDRAAFPSLPHGLIWAAALLLLTGCGGGLQRRGEPQTGPASVAVGRFSVLTRFGRNELPEDPEPANRALAEGAFQGLPRHCTPTPWAGPGQAQQALFDYLAAQLRAGFGVPLSELAIGQVAGLPADCRHVVLFSGRQGGTRAGWLLLGVVRVTDGQLLATSSHPVTPEATLQDLGNLSRRLASGLLR